MSRKMLDERIREFVERVAPDMDAADCMELDALMIELGDILDASLGELLGLGGDA